MEIKRLSDQMISESFAKHAQDVYIASFRSILHLFSLWKKRTFWKKVSSADGQQLISRFKYLGQMDIGEKKSSVRCIYLFFRKQEVRLRLSSVGDYLQRESLVIRLLYGTLKHPIVALVLEICNYFTENRQTWIIPFSGPVGSGKTSLMYRLALEENCK